MAERPLNKIQWIIPYYRNAPMLEVHVRNWSRYTPEVLENLRVILVDDGSPEPDRPDAILKSAPDEVRSRIRLLRILEDIPWNQHGARNLGAHVAEDGWLLITDMDRVLLNADMRAVMAYKLKVSRFYKPVGVRMHPTLLVEDGEKGPYNQLIIHRKTYWRVGGYDEDYCGHYGGDTPFLRAVASVVQFERIRSARMYRYNRHVVYGANTEGLDRSTEAGKEIYARKMATGDTFPRNPLRFKWQEIPI